MSGPPESRARAREAGVSFFGLPTGEHNAITDVPGVKVGHCTLWHGEGELVVGSGPVRTGCTAILPGPGNIFRNKVPGAVHVVNGFGKAVGLAQVQELGEIESPILLTNTLNVPRAADAVLDYLLQLNDDIGVKTSTVNPVVAECNDGNLNDIRGRHVRTEHVRAALDSAGDGPVQEGVVGAGTGMRCFGYKGGIGTSSRRVRVWSGTPEEPTDIRTFTVGVLVLANFGRPRQLRVAGLPVGQFLAQEEDCEKQDRGSIVMVVATDAPVDARQLTRIARRAGMGLARTGSTAGHGSGDFVIAFSNAYRIPHQPEAMSGCRELLHDNHPGLNRLFSATVEATEESILNALFVADTVEGRDGNRAEGLPVERVLQVIRSCGPELAVGRSSEHE